MKNRLIKNGVWLLLGTIINMVIMLMMQVILARNLNLDEYGAIMSAFNFINFLALFISLGASDYIFKSFGIYGIAAYKIVQTWMKFLPISITALIFMVIITYISGIFGDLTSVFLLLIIPNIILQGLLPLTISIYQIEENYKKIVIINLVLYISRLLAATISMFFGSNIYMIAISLSILSIIGLLYYFFHLKRYFKEDLQLPCGIVEELNEVGLLKITLKGVKPYALLAFFYYGFYQSNIIFINIFINEESVALYNAAFSIISLTFLLPGIILGQLVNPKLHFWIVNDVKKIITVFINGSKWMFLIGIAIATAVFFLSEHLINIIFGAKFVEAAAILKWLIIIIPFRYVQAVSDVIMNIENQIYIKLKIFFVVFIVSLILNVTLIPKMKLEGVILAVIISELLLLILTILFAWRFIKIKRMINKSNN